MPNLTPEQRKIVRLIKREGRNIRDPHARRVYERAAVQTGLVESGLRNLKYGDADSAGWRQERASLYRDPTNLRASIRRFRQEFEEQYQPGERSYQVAAQVQRPREDLRGRYHDVAGQAAQVLRRVGGGAGAGSGGAQGPSYRTVPGVDNAGTRAGLMQQYFSRSHDPDALLELKSGLEGAADVPSRRVRVRTPNSSKERQTFGDGVGGELHELFYNGPGGVNVKNGQRVPKGFVEGHTDHVHVAGGPRSVVALGQLAQRMGLHVGENPRFGGVGGSHVEGSYHYKREAIDVSGDPKKMAAFARRVARIYNV